MVKFRYKPFWLLVEKMIRHGYIHVIALKKKENVYARGQRVSVTTILRQIQLNERQGGHAEL